MVRSASLQTCFLLTKKDARNLGFDRDIIRDNPEKPWNWYNLSSNVNITPDIIRENPEREWDWEYISLNPNITFDIIRENPEKKWNWSSISGNKFSKEKEDFIRQKYRDYFMGKGIDYTETSLFRELMEKVWSPDNLERNVYIE